MADAAVVVETLDAGYEETVLHGVDFKVARGSYVGIFGPNGAGKSTLLKVICGLLRPRAGSLEVLGRPIRSRRDRDWVRRQIGYLTQIQAPGQLPISVVESVLLGRWGRFFSGLRRPSKEDYRRVHEVLELLGMTSLAQRDFQELSGGQRQKVALARALVRDPEILLMDEPTTYLDPSAQESLVHEIQQLRRALDVTIIVVTHQIHHNWDFRDQWSMDQGRLQKVGGPLPWI